VTGFDVSIAAGILGVFYAAIQILDRLYLQPKQAEATKENYPLAQLQSPDCRLQHAALTTTVAQLAETQRDLVHAQAEMSRAVTALVSSITSQASIAEMRHNELVRQLERRNER
jgi:ribulose kinase